MNDFDNAPIAYRKIKIVLLRARIVVVRVFVAFQSAGTDDERLSERFYDRGIARSELQAGRRVRAAQIDLREGTGGAPFTTRKVQTTQQSPPMWLSAAPLRGS